ncbi:MAG: GTPase Era [Lactobacillus sp.]|jgi:GTP-binding protein Era|nr:GTPase Era [Lactobacillus sp.]
MMDKTNNFKSGFVALIGEPNVGKSTLLNYLVGEKVAIMSPKPQTTRNKIAGIYTDDQQQIVFLDTPGLHPAQNSLDTYMDQASLSALKDVDAVLFMVEPTKVSAEDKKIADYLRKVQAPVFLVINKIDSVHPDALLPVIAAYQKLGKFAEVFPISAAKGINVADLIKGLHEYLPTGPQYYDQDQLTDRPEYFIVAELIREQILRLTKQEVPHETAVVVEQMNEFRANKRQVIATIYVERPGQKGIIIGKNGQMLKQIGIAARQEIEQLLGEKINLRLWVKVQPHWREDPVFLQKIGYSKKEFN